MTDIKKNAPEGATHYKINKYYGVIYLKLIGGKFHYCFEWVYQEPISYSEDIKPLWQG